MAIKKVTLGSRWMDGTSISERLEQSRQNRRLQSELLSSLEEQVQRRRDDVERSLADLSPGQRSSVVTRAVGGFRGELKRSSANARLKHVREAGRLLEEVKTARVHYASSVQMLMREGLGSERRSRILQQIERSGPTELAMLAEYAAAKGDRELGAALCSRVVQLNPKERPFSPSELADVLIGGEQRRIIQELMEIERLTVEAAHADSTFERGGSNAVRGLQIARMRRSEAELEVEQPNVEEE